MQTPKRERQFREMKRWAKEQRASMFRPRDYVMPIAQLEWVIEEIDDYWNGIKEERACKHVFTTQSYPALDGTRQWHTFCVRCNQMWVEGMTFNQGAR